MSYEGIVFLGGGRSIGQDLWSCKIFDLGDEGGEEICVCLYVCVSDAGQLATLVEGDNS